MLKVRIIPVLTFNGFGLVKTKQFKAPRMVGNPVQAARVYNSRGVDELIFLDIFASAQKRKVNLKIVRDVLKECFMPVGIGGGVNTIEDINDLLKIGADKVVIKTCALENSNFIREAANFFGSQCITVAADIHQNDEGDYMVYSNTGITISMQDFLSQVASLGAGEIVLTSVNKEGLMKGFDINMVSKAEKLVQLPIIVVGGAGNLEHFKELFEQTNCQAVGASSIFHFTRFTPEDIKRELAAIHKPVRL